MTIKSNSYRKLMVATDKYRSGYDAIDWKRKESYEAIEIPRGQESFPWHRFYCDLIVKQPNLWTHYDQIMLENLLPAHPSERQWRLVPFWLLMSITIGIALIVTALITLFFNS